MFKEWSVGDLAKDDAFDGTTTYNVIEAFETNDRVNKKDLARPLRNVFENDKDNHQFLSSWANFTSMESGVIKDALVSEFEFAGDSDVFPITIDPGTGDTTSVYIRLVPGAALYNSKLAVNRPTLHIAERQLSEIFNLETYGTEGVEIKYYHIPDLYQARIKRKNVDGVTVIHDFLNSGTWGDSDGGYSSGLQLLEAIYDDTTYFRDEFADAIGTDLLQINLEPSIKGDTGDTYYWYVDANGLFVGDTYPGDSANTFPLYTISVAVGGDSSDYWLDQRTYIQNFNDFSTFTFFNTPQEWGDTRSELLTDPYGDTNLDYADVTNQDTMLVFLRKSAGDTQDNSIFGWAEDAVPGISVTRTEKFFANKDIISHWDEYGDTLGASWASIKEMSGDSWTFYNAKHFFDYESAAVDSFKFDTIGGMDIDVNEGFRVDEDSGSIMDLNTSGTVYLQSGSASDITLISDGNINLTAAGDSIIFNAATFAVTVTEYVLNTTNHNLGVTGDFTLTVGDSLLFTAPGIYLRGDSSSSIDMEPLGAINIISAVDKDISITSSGTTADINVTAAADIIFTATGDSIVFNANIIDYNLTETFDVDASTSIELDGQGAIASAIKIEASNAAGGVDIDAGTGGVAINTTAGGNIDITAGDELNFYATASDMYFEQTGSGGSFMSLYNSGGIELGAATQVVFTANAGRIALTAQGAASGIELLAGDDIELFSGGTADILLDADNNEIDLTGTLIDINAGTGGFDLDATSGNIAMNTITGGNISLDSIGSVTINSDTGTTLNENSGSSFTMATAGTIAAVTASAQNLTLTATSAIVDINGNELQVDTSTFDVNSATQTYNGTTFTGSFTGAVSMASDTGLTLSDDGGATITLQNAGDIDITTANTEDDITLTSGGDIDLIATGDTIQLTAYTLDVNTTTTRIDGTTLDINASTLDVDSLTNINFTTNGQVNFDLNTSTSSSAFKIDTIGGIDLDTNSGFRLDDDSGAYMYLNSSGEVGLFAASGQELYVTSSGAGKVNINSGGNIVNTTTGQVHLLGASGVQVGSTGGGYKLSHTSSVSGYASYSATDNGLVVSGSLGAYKVYNAVWNDYAEGFKFDSQAGTPQPGFVYKQTDSGVVKTYKKGEKGTIGVYSDTAGMVMGSKDCIIPELIGTDEDQSGKTKIPIALAGKVRVWVKNKFEIGDLMIADKGGFATKANFIDRIFRQDSIIGKALEESFDNKPKRIWMLVK